MQILVLGIGVFRSDRGGTSLGSLTDEDYVDTGNVLGAEVFDTDCHLETIVAPWSFWSLLASLPHNSKQTQIYRQVKEPLSIGAVYYPISPNSSTIVVILRSSQPFNLSIHS